MGTLPRFFSSKIYEKMRAFKANSSPLPTADDINVPAPTKCTILNAYKLDELENRYYDLSEVLQDGLLYNEFLSYLQVAFCSENLLCVRMILLFEEQVKCKNYSEALKLSWHICNCFVLPGSAFEVSLLYGNRKEILLSLARPNLFMFSHLKCSAMKSLHADFEAYSITESYKKLNSLMIAAKRKEESVVHYITRNVSNFLPKVKNKK